MLKVSVVHSYGIYVVGINPDPVPHAMMMHSIWQRTILHKSKPTKPLGTPTTSTSCCHLKQCNHCPILGTMRNVQYQATVDKKQNTKIIGMWNM